MLSERNKAVIAMSGGVDSSTAAFLIRETGCDCVGITMRLFNKAVSDKKEDTEDLLSDDIEDAQNIAARLGFPHYVLDYSEVFREAVIDRFVRSYQNGCTPNPCIDCNRYLKFGYVFEKMQEMGCNYLVTGHYARIEYDERKKRYLLKKAVDPGKDQSYVLYTLTQEQLAHVKFPLGTLTKHQVRKLAEENGFVNARKHDSQDICFVPDGDYAAFIEKYLGTKDTPGAFVDLDGEFISMHKGITHYTIGQRRGLGIPAGRRVYVCRINPDDHTVVLGDDKDLFGRELVAGQVNLISCDSLKDPINVSAKIRYRHNEQPAVAWMDDSGKLHVRFDLPQRAITCGQSVVLYDGDTVVGGGIIESLTEKY